MFVRPLNYRVNPASLVVEFKSPTYFAAQIQFSVILFYFFITWLLLHDTKNVVFVRIKIKFTETLALTPKNLTGRGRMKS